MTKRNGWDVLKERGTKTLRSGILSTRYLKKPVTVDWIIRRKYNRRGEPCAAAYEICLAGAPDEVPRKGGGGGNFQCMWSDDFGDDFFGWEPRLVTAEEIHTRSVPSGISSA